MQNTVKAPLGAFFLPYDKRHSVRWGLLRRQSLNPQFSANQWSFALEGGLADPAAIRVQTPENWIRM